MPSSKIDTQRVPAQQMALRVAMISTIAFVLFAIIFFRLWYLQVLDGDKYLAEASQNQSRTEYIAAPRGEILDRQGRTIVGNRSATVVTLDAGKIPKDFRAEIAAWGQSYGQWDKRATAAVGPIGSDRSGIDRWRARASKKIGAPPPMPRASGRQWQLYRRLGRVLDRSPLRINNAVVSGIVASPFGNVTIKNDVDRAQRQYITERYEQFPGVAIEQLYRRSYPQGETLAQALGGVGEIGPQELKKRRYKGLKPGTIIGTGGLEKQYDRYLRGVDGAYDIQVNAFGDRRGRETAREPKPGRNLRLTVDLDLQKAARSAVAQIAGGRGAAFVAMNPRSGEIYTSGSLPDYNPRELAGPFETRAEYDAKFGEGAGSPLFNRAVSGGYPVGSTFKPVVALAALDSGVTTPGKTFNDQGSIKTGSRDADIVYNAGRKVYGAVDMVSALEVSSDTYFIDLALKMFGKKGWPLQKWAGKLGFGRRSGIDLPEATRGSVPGPKLFKEITEKELACRKKRKVPSCGIGSGDPDFRVGDLGNLSLGQGGLLASPLQLAVAYSTIINSGKVPRPHLGKQIEDDRGVITKIAAPAGRRVAISAAARSTVMEGLRSAATGERGTSTSVWAGGNDSWPDSRFPIYGKTGTSEVSDGRGGLVDQSWYAGYSYRGSPERDPIVVVVTIEKGGFGAATAAPAARLIMSHFFGVTPEYVQGASQDR